ncbi:DUF4366 domain-containing protein [bacterium 1XD8-76]|nr:DUF4366 domain-containing protein [bacterium 1XD8-76]
MKKKYRVIAAALCAAFLMCGITTTAYAGGGEEWEDGTGGPEWEGLDPVEPTEPAEPPEAEPNPFTPDGQGTMVDNATDGDGKEFFTIMAADESVFYLVIDRQRETENVYFLNAVTVADLMALAEPSPEIVPEPLPTTEPDTETDPEPEVEPEPEKSGGAGTLLLVLAVLGIGGGAGWYFKIYRPKQQQSAGPGEDFDEAEEYGGDYDGGEYDDLPPWDEEEETEGGA